MHIKKSKPCFLLAHLCCSLAVTAEVMCSNTSSSSVAVIQGMMAWQTWSQMVHLGAPEAACWQDTHVTQETLLSSASASDTFVRSSSLICITDTLSGYVTHFFFFKIFELHTSILAFWGVIVNTIQKIKICTLRSEFLFLRLQGDSEQPHSSLALSKLTLLTPCLCLSCDKVLLADLIKVRRYI